jgi:hypothetical protein
MPDIYINRKIFTDKSTVGKLVFGYFNCWTLEDTMRHRDLNNDGKLQASEKIYGQTAIPAGVYEVFIKDSERFKRPMPYLKNVPLFDGIMIHPGNFSINTFGCILVGAGHSMVDKIDDSKKAFDLLFPLISDALKIAPLKIHIAGGYTADEYLIIKQSGTV